MNHARMTGGPRPTTLRLVPSDAAEAAPSRQPIASSTYDDILQGLVPVDPVGEVPAPAPQEVPSAPEAPSIPEPSEPATPAQPEEPIQPIDPTPDEETPDPEPAEVPS